MRDHLYPYRDVRQQLDIIRTRDLRTESSEFPAGLVVPREPYGARFQGDASPVEESDLTSHLSAARWREERKGITLSSSEYQEYALLGAALKTHPAISHLYIGLELPGLTTRLQLSEFAQGNGLKVSPRMLHLEFVKFLLSGPRSGKVPLLLDHYRSHGVRDQGGIIDIDEVRIATYGAFTRPRDPYSALFVRYR